MPRLPPLPEESTARYYLSYLAGPFEHTLIQRVAEGVTDAEAIGVYHNLLTTITPLIYRISIVNLEFSELGSNVRNPVVWTGDEEYGEEAVPAGAQASFLSMTGRSRDGRKTKFELFCWRGTFPTTFRVSAGSNVTVGDVREYLNGLTDHFVTISGRKTIWNAYVNVSTHDHFVDESRG